MLYSKPVTTLLAGMLSRWSSAPPPIGDLDNVASCSPISHNYTTSQSPFAADCLEILPNYFNESRIIKATDCGNVWTVGGCAFVLLLLSRDTFNVTYSAVWSMLTNSLDTSATFYPDNCDEARVQSQGNLNCSHDGILYWALWPDTKGTTFAPMPDPYRGHCPDGLRLPVGGLNLTGIW